MGVMGVKRKSKKSKPEQVEIYISKDTVTFDAYTVESRKIGERIAAKNNKNKIKRS
jgi:hypothetical protein